MGFASRTPFITTLNTLQAGITPLCKNTCLFPFSQLQGAPWNAAIITLQTHPLFFPLLLLFLFFWVVKQHLQNRRCLKYLYPSWIARVCLTGHWLSPVTSFLFCQRIITSGLLQSPLWKSPSSSSCQRLSQRDGMNHSSSSNLQLMDFPKGGAGIVNRHLGDAFQQILCSREFKLVSGLEKSHSHLFECRYLRKEPKLMISLF